MDCLSVLECGEFDDTTKAQAKGFLRQLNEFAFIFLSNALHEIFQSTVGHRQSTDWRKSLEIGSRGFGVGSDIGDIYRQQI